MAKNEAKIKFTAETGKFNDSIKKSNKEMSELRAELKLNDAQMKNNGSSVEALEKKHDILENQLKSSQDKTEALNQKLEKAVEIFGENSDEASKLKIQLANAQTAEQNLQKAISACEQEIKDQTRAEKDAASASRQLSDSIGDQENQLSKLKSEYADAVIVYGKNSDEAKQLGKEIDNLSTELKENKDKLEAAEKEADKFDNTIDDVGNTTDATVPKLDKLAVGIAAIGAAAIAAGKEAIEAFNEVDEGADNVIKATGATGEAAAELEESYKKVASTVVGDFANIGSTLGEVNTRFGYTGSEAEEATTKFLKFSEITGVDSVEAVQAVTRALNDSGIPLNQYDTLLDQLAKAGQSAGIDVTTLADSLSENGSIMRSMGFNTQETIALLAQFELSGANSSAMLTGMKKAMATWADEGKNGNVEFAKMVQGIQNGSVSAADAIDVFGTKAGPMLVDAIKSGKFEYNDMLNTIQNSKGTLESTFDGTVDGGYELELAMQNAKMALAEAGGEIGTALIPAFKMFSENVLPVATKAIGAMVDGISSAVGWMKEHKGIVTALGVVIGVLATAITAYNVVQGIKTAMDAANVTTVWGLVAAHWAQATAAMAAIAPYILVVAAIAAVIAIIVLCIKYWDEIVSAVKKAASACWEAIKTAWDWIANLFSSVGSWFYSNVIQPVINFFVGMWDGIVAGAKAAWNWICDVVQFGVMLIGSILQAAFDIITLPFRFIWENCKEYIFAAWNAIVSFLTPIINKIKTAITTTWNAIKSATVTAFNAVKSAVTTAWNAIKSAITAVANAIKNTVTSIWNGIKSVSVSVFNAVKSAVTTAWNGIKSGVTTAVNAVKSTVTNVFNSVKSTVSNIFNGIKSVATSVWNGIKSAITKPIEAARDKIKGIIDKIKGFFSGLKINLPKIKLPHFKIEGKLSLSPPSVPKLKIDWYKEGGILTKPTIFGMNGTSLMAGGEAGAEAILPIDKLQGYIMGAIEKTQNVINLDTLAAAVEDLANRPIEMNINGRQFALATAGDTDNVSGMRNRFKERGLILD